MEMYELKLTPNLQKLTDEEFYQLCQANSEAKLERTKDGEIIIMPPTGGETGSKNLELGTDLTIWNRNKKLGIAFDPSTGFNLPNGATRSPDAS